MTDSTAHPHSGSKKKKLRSQSPERTELRQAITQLSRSISTLVELIKALQDLNITVKTNLKKQTISYSKNQQTFSGSALGKNFSLKGLQNLGIHVDLDRDRDEILALIHRSDNSDNDENAGFKPSEFWDAHFEVPTQAPQSAPEQWTTAKEALAPYKFPITLLDTLHEQQWLYADTNGRPVFIERTFDDTDYHGLVLAEDGFFHPTDERHQNHPSSVFWIATGYPFARAIIADDPLEVLALYSLDQGRTRPVATLYFCAHRHKQIPTDILDGNLAIYISKSCLSPIQALKTRFPQAKILDPGHKDSWRGVWLSTPAQPTASTTEYSYQPVNRQRQLQL